MEFERKECENLVICQLFCTFVSDSTYFLLQCDFSFVFKSLYLLDLNRLYLLLLVKDVFRNSLHLMIAQVCDNGIQASM